MKRNKLAAGALALALGFGAVAPSFADDAKTTRPAAKSQELFAEVYAKELKRANELRDAYLVDAAAYEEAEAKLEAARLEVKEAAKAWDDIVNAKSTEAEGLRERVTEALNELNEFGYVKSRGALISEEKTYVLPTIVIDGVSHSGKIVIPENRTADEWDIKAAYVGDAAAEAEFAVRLERYQNAVADLNKWTEKANNDASDALLRVKAAETARDVAQRAFDKAEAKYNSHFTGKRLNWEIALDAVKAAADGYNVTITADGNEIVVINNEDDADDEAAKRAKLEAAIERAEVQIQAVRFLQEKTPETIKDIAKELEALVKEQEARIATAKAALAKETASLFVSTAYASEDEDLDALADELNNTSDKIDSLLEENEKAQEEKNEEKVEEETEKEEETADNADDNKEEKTTVVEKKTVVTPATTNKKAGSNAKTGIAGVAGVAGVLAAASAAYAASKKN